jgi:hypothetical protein
VAAAIETPGGIVVGVEGDVAELASVDGDQSSAFSEASPAGRDGGVSVRGSRIASKKTMLALLS